MTRGMAQVPHLHLRIRESEAAMKRTAKMIVVARKIAGKTSLMEAKRMVPI